VGEGQIVGKFTHSNDLLVLEAVQSSHFCSYLLRTGFVGLYSVHGTQEVT